VPENARPGGLEPPTSALGVPRSIQLSYGRTTRNLLAAKDDGSCRLKMGSGRAETEHIPPMSTAPPGFSIERDLPAGFAAFYRPLHEAFTPRQQAVIAARKRVLDASISGDRPQYPEPSAAQGDWRIELPAWCADQRNQMTGPADDHELGVKMLNSGAPGVMIDLEDSMANEFAHTLQGHRQRRRHVLRRADLRRQKRGGNVVRSSRRDGAVDARARTAPLASRHLREPTSASLFDLALLAYKLDFSRLQAPAGDLHPEVGVGRRSALVARRVSRRRESEGPRRPARDQGDGAGRSAPVRVRRSRSSPTRCATICWA
jgi:hypothetical protein